MDGMGVKLWSVAAGVMLGIIGGLIVAGTAAGEPPVYEYGDVRGPDLFKTHAFPERADFFKRPSGVSGCDGAIDELQDFDNYQASTDARFPSATFSTADFSACPGGDESGEIPFFRFNFSTPLSFDTLNVRLLGNGLVGIGSETTNISFFDSGGVEIHEATFPASDPSEMFVNVSLFDVQRIDVLVFCDPDCTTAGSVTWQLDEIHAWNTTTDIYPIEQAYVDYLAIRANRDQPAAGAVPSETLESASIVVPPGTGFYYAAIFTASPCDTGSTAHDCYVDMIPQAQDGLSFTRVGVSYAWQQPRPVSYSVFAYNNSAGSPVITTLMNGTSDFGIVQAGGCNDTNAAPCSYFGNWTGSIGALFALCPQGSPGEVDCLPAQSTTTTPFGRGRGWDGETVHSLANATYGFGYKDFSGPFQSVTFDSFGWGGNTDQLDLEKTLTVGYQRANLATDGTFTVDLGDIRGQYAGSVVYLVMGRITGDILCPAPPDTASDLRINGLTTQLAFQTNYVEASLGQTVHLCGWILDDFTKRNGLNLIDGQNRYHDNLVFGGTRQYFIELPAALQGFSDWRTPQLVQGNHSHRTVCNSDEGVCFGNAVTTGQDVPFATVEVDWRWNVTDAGQGTPLGDVFVFEERSAVSGSTGANGLVNITTTTDRVNWTAIEEGYNTLDWNSSFLANGQVFIMNLRMSRNLSTPFYTTECQGTGPLETTCFINATSSIELSCQDHFGQDGSCRTGPAFNAGFKFVQTGCPVEDTNSGLSGLDNVTFFESHSQVSFEFSAGDSPLARTVPMDCETFSTTEIQSNVMNITFSKPGFRTLNFDADWLTAGVIKFVPIFQTGDGDASEVQISVVNTTVTVGGQAKSASLISIEDTGADGVSSIGAGGFAIGAELLALGVQAFGGDVFGRGLLGLVVFLAIIIGVLAASKAVTGTAPPKELYVVSAMPAFLVVALLGVWEAPVIVAAVLGVVALLVASLRGVRRVE